MKIENLERASRINDELAKLKLARSKFSIFKIGGNVE